MKNRTGPGLAARIEALLPQVSKPARYLGSEIGVRRKGWPADPGAGVAWLLILPEIYEIGMSHQGLRILYDILNRREDALAERAFAPWFDMEEAMRDERIPLFSLESRRPARDFDVIGFSLQYELLVTNILNLLDLAQVAPLARDRREDDPLIAAGGPCTGNPEPVADFFDFILIGDGEASVGAITESILAHRGRSREERLLALAQLPGIYVPRFYEPVIGGADGARQVGVRPLREDVPPVIRRTYLDSLTDAPYPAEPVVPLIEAVQDRLTLEIQRGCTHGCRFCQAGIFYRPLRERSPETLVQLVASGLPATGWNEISLSSLSSADYSHIRPLAETLVEVLSSERIGLSFSSLRVGTFSVELAELVSRVRKTGFTFAPEAGTQRLRNVINKDVREEDLLSSIEDAYARGWQRVKLYFMAGLPTEQDEDIEGIIDLVERIRAIGRRFGGSRKVTASVGPFVPKAHTPFQWEAFAGTDRLLEKAHRLEQTISSRWSAVRFHDPRVSEIEAVLSRGDRRLSATLLEVWRRGARFDGWGDHFDPDRWAEAFLATGIDPGFYLKAIPVGEGLPWDHIDLGVSGEFLRRERENALAGKITPDCRNGRCHGCGMGCAPGEELAAGPPAESWQALRRKLREALNARVAPGTPDTPDTPDAPQPVRYRLTFRKHDRLRFISHLETMRLFQKVMRMTHWPLAYSGGHHPHPRFSFGPPLPLGVEGEAESLDVTLLGERGGAGDAGGLADLIDAFNRRAPEGLELIGSVPIEGKLSSLASAAVQADYAVMMPADLAAQAQREERVEAFLQAGSVIVLKPSKGRQKTVDLRRCVNTIAWTVSPGKNAGIAEPSVGPGETGAVPWDGGAVHAAGTGALRGGSADGDAPAPVLTLRLRLQEPSGHVLGILHVLRELFKWSDRDLGRCRVVRLGLLQEDGSILAATTTPSG